MSLDAINEIQSRISDIQQSFNPASTSSQQSTTATAAQNLQFADLLNAASSLGSDDTGSDGTTTDSLTGTGATDTSSISSALASALGLSSGTGDSSVSDALVNAVGGSTNGGLGDLESLLGQNGQSGLGNLDPNSIASLAQLLGAGASAATSGSTAIGTAGVNSAGNQKFVQSALAMSGDSYVYGASGSPLDPHPKSFDCSGLTQWAAARAGVTLPRTAQQQYLALKNQGDLIPVQQAINTPGALLFSFSSEPSPTNMYPSHAHVAISLGNGKTIEARGHAYGVGIFDAGNRFNYAGVIPGLTA